MDGQAVVVLLCLLLALVTILIILVIILAMHVEQLRKNIVELERPCSCNNPVRLTKFRQEESTIPPVKPISGTCSWTRPEPRPGQASPQNNRPGEEPVPSAPATVNTCQVLAGSSQEQMQLHHQFVYPTVDPDSSHDNQDSTSNSSSEMIADLNIPDRPRLQTMDISDI